MREEKLEEREEGASLEKRDTVPNIVIGSSKQRADGWNVSWCFRIEGKRRRSAKRKGKVRDGYVLSNVLDRERFSVGERYQVINCVSFETSRAFRACHREILHR